MMIDEIETSLHPLLVREIIGLFASLHLPEASGYPQLLFTTHNPLLLDQTLLRRDQIWFTEKDREGATRLYPLTDYKPRNDEALVKGYLAGRYGGIPFIPEGLLAP
jgi:AAA15 family ATPase/GTPase